MDDYNIDKILSAAKKLNVEAEIFSNSQDSTTLTVENDKVTSISKKIISGYGMRVIVGQKIGYAYTTDVSQLNKYFDYAIKNAAYANQELLSFPEQISVSKPKNLFDKNVLDIEDDALIDMVQEMLNTIKNYNKEIYLTNNSIGLVSYLSKIQNTAGLKHSGKKTVCSTDFEISFKDSVFYGSSESTKLKSLDTIDLVKDISSKVVLAQNKKQVVSKLQTVILHPSVVSDILNNTFISAINAENLQSGRSYLEGKIGQMIASESVSIIDDGLMSGGIGSYAFDREGMPRQKTKIIEKGVFKGFLYDCIRGQKDNVKSTGNAVGDFTVQPSINTTNFCINSSNKSLDKLIASVDSGIIIYSVMGSHMSNSVTGDFSLTLLNAFIIEKGVIRKATKGGMYVGNVYDVLKKIVGTSDVIKQVDGVVTPYISVKDQKIVG
ncbi:MAG: TldD/PmbA family protein [DPANN group archaeon]|nr:TldD/PmbA family protein [DPANN group archaeon]